MRANEHDLNSLRGIVRKLQEKNASLKRLLDENNIVYASSENDDANTDDLGKREVDSLRHICKIAGIDALTERGGTYAAVHLSEIQ